MSRSEQGKALAVAGLSFVCTAVVELAIKFSQWWIAMIVLAIGLAFILVGFVYARRRGEEEKHEAEAREKARDEAAQKARDQDREERNKERQEDKLERQREREEEQERRSLDAVEAKERADKEKAERDRAEEANRVSTDQQDLAAIQKLNGCPQTDAYQAFVQANRTCGNCKTMYPRRQFIRNDLVKRHDWLTCACLGCAARLWPRGKQERMWLDDYKLQVNWH
jgi:hypothetical protein